MGCGESKEKNKIRPKSVDDITPKVYFNVENVEESAPSSQEIPATPKKSEKRNGNEF